MSLEYRTVEVHNLRTDEVRVYTGLCPSEAVIAAYAQEHGDWNTWNYGQHRYKPQFGKRTVSLGDWCALL
jgi:hypothetical protein